ncbi:hypothetical protein HGH93_05315 [Chitinophaga polysaccharea]|uniref:nitrous oxide reductase accessory protein NosL n=1 Tax=Chitinophaga TaxID=79328 RepID=UPI0014550CAA|nr:MULTISPECIES: nitrous oxide reductase accessory protein NosL [Chitinophaga]NLR57505.1 hypothetical protein [Chitinophaga polysaccharea]NLU95419.1 hypothetical protein [Chitinophaga sp. Ak27]
MENKPSIISRMLLFAAALSLAASLFVPIWSIYLDAPQYPEGLCLRIWAHKIAGDIDIINGLNHYIGMKRLHTADFIEFTVLPYIIVFFALLFAATAVFFRKRRLYIVFAAFVLFGIIAMADFWKWEYDYGHHLDPNAAIKVPGMAYQPPLIGFKQLLNFGAYSVPYIGGWLFVGAGLLLLIAVLKEAGALRQLRRNPKSAAAAISILFILTSCSHNGPDPINLHKDACDFCKMSISDGRFMGEVTTRKGRVYKFDDMHCLLSYVSGMGKEYIGNYYTGSFEKEHELIDATTAWYVVHESLRSPMGGNIAAFATKSAADTQASRYGTSAVDWKTLCTAVSSDSLHHDHEQ